MPFRQAHLSVLPVLLCFTLAIPIAGADWLATRGDAQRTGWQPLESNLTPKTVKGIRLLWQKSLGAEALSSPLLLGPIVTHRGIKELVIVAGGSGKVFAVDADLGTVFWTRDLPAERGRKTCSSSTPLMPTILSSQVAALPARNSPQDEEFSDGNRPLLVTTAEGVVHILRTSTGEDAQPAHKIDDGQPTAFVGFGDVLYAASPKACDQPPSRLDQINFKPSAPAGRLLALPAGQALTGIAVGIHGVPYLNLTDQNLGRVAVINPLTLQMDAPSPPMSAGRSAGSTFSDSNILAFPWRGKEWAATVTMGRLALWDMTRRDKSGEFSTGVSIAAPGQTQANPSPRGGLATWESLDGGRWLCALATQGGSLRLQAFRMAERNGRPLLASAWQSNEFQIVGAPIVAAGVIYFLETVTNAGPGLRLVALDASNGELLTSVAVGGSETKCLSSGLALANGHLCFTTSDGTLSCFGLPLEI